jgi:glutamate N-acetyltransferase/amino-acid N-acetyltransferase
LVKTAIYGKDANWGRIVCAVGYSGVDIHPGKVNLHFSATLKPELSLHLFKNGEPHQIDEEIASKILDNEDLLVHIELGLGEESFSMFTCDMSHEYISINADYRS